MPHNENPMDKQFAPKQPVNLDKPKDAIITQEELAAADGSDPDKPTYVAIKGVVFDVSRNKAYQAGGSYAGRNIIDFTVRCGSEVLTDDCSLRRKRPLPCSRILVFEEGGMCT